MLNNWVNFRFSIMKKILDLAHERLTQIWPFVCILKMKLIFHEPSLFCFYFCIIQSCSFSQPENEESSSSNDVKFTSMTVMTTFAITLGTIYYLSYMVMGNSWTFMYSTLGFTLAVPELTPNMGLFWYFFTEMFEHFRVFFVCTFQINCFVYVYPLASRLKNQVLHFRS